LKFVFLIFSVWNN